MDPIVRKLREPERGPSGGSKHRVGGTRANE